MFRNLYRLLILSLILLAMQAIIVGPHHISTAFAQVDTQDNQTLISELPLTTRLNADGTLRFDDNFSGSLNLQGWQMELDGDGQPRFVPIKPAGFRSRTSEIGTADTGEGTWVGFAGVAGETNPVIQAIAISGDNLYVGGTFTEIGGVKANNIARWNRATNSWSALGDGVTDTNSQGTVKAIAIIGLEIYVGGKFTKPDHNIARWNTTTNTWLSLPGSQSSGLLDYIATIIAGNGPDVYVGGQFSNIGSSGANDIARYNRETGSWSALGQGVFLDYVNVITVNNDEIYVGSKQGIALWNSTTGTWSGLGNGVQGRVFAIAVKGKDVYVGGDFGRAGNVSTKALARWDKVSNAWFAVGSGLQGNSSGAPVVNSIAISDDDVYVGGQFSQAGGVSVKNIARWNTTDLLWWSMNNGVDSKVSAMQLNGAELFVGGSLTKPAGVRTTNIVYWDEAASNWNEISSDIRYSDTTLGSVLALTPSDIFVNSSRLIYLGGQFRDHLACVTLSGFCGTGIPDDNVYALAASGSQIYVGGQFASVNNINANNIVSMNWNGQTYSWSSLGSGTNGPVEAIAVSGNDIYVGGRFTIADGVTASRIARWNTTTSTWSPLASGLNGNVYAIAVSGNDIYVGGQFSNAGGVAVANIARWNNATGSWSALGSGVNGPVEAISISNGLIYVGGKFTTAGGITTPGIARWDGANWADVGGGTNGDVRGIAINGSQIYIGGRFSMVGGVSASNIARWDNTANTWTSLGSGVDGPVEALGIAENNLFVGGQFSTAGGLVSHRYARYTFNPVPQIISVTPNQGSDNQPTSITINGINFTSSPTVKLSITPLNITSVSDTQIKATVPNGMTPGPYALIVTNSYGESGVLQNAFTVVETTPPQITSVTPDEVQRNIGITPVTIQGANFVRGSKVLIGDREIDSANILFNSPDELKISLLADIFPTGTYDVTVITVNGWTATLPNALSIFQIVANSNFRPNPDGYSFPNYGGVNRADFTIEDMRRAFGDQAVCWLGGSGKCIPRPAAIEWNRWANEKMNGGHCDGMAVTSLRFDRRFDYPNTFQNGATETFDLQINNTHRHIAYYFIRQLADPVKAYKNQIRQKSPIEILTELRNAIGTPNPVTLFVRQNGSGHAITPYKVEDRGSGVYWVRVYDNNWPNDFNRYVEIDTTMNTWNYNLGWDKWGGDAKTKSMGIVPISQYAIQPGCAWCSSLFSFSNDVPSSELWFEGEAKVLITDSQGRRFGYVGEQFIEEVPGAYETVSDGGLGVATNPIYNVPLNGSQTILLDGQTLTQTTTMKVVQFGPGYAVTVDDVTLDPAEQDQLIIAANGSQLTYHADEAKTPDFTLALDDTQVSYQFQIKDAEVGDNQTVSVTADKSQGKLVFNNAQTSGGSYNLQIEQVSEAGEQAFIHNDLTIAPGDTHYLSYEAWDGSGEMILEVDQGSNGSIDQTISLENQGTKIYLPIIIR